MILCLIEALSVDPMKSTRWFFGALWEQTANGKKLMKITDKFLMQILISVQLTLLRRMLIYIADKAATRSLLNIHFLI